MTAHQTVFVAASSLCLGLFALLSQPLLLTASIALGSVVALEPRFRSHL